MEDNKITKLVRPGAVIWVSALLTFMVLADGNLGEFAVKTEYLPLISTIAIAIYTFFFTSRGIEKTAGIIKDR